MMKVIFIFIIFLFSFNAIGAGGAEANIVRKELCNERLRDVVNGLGNQSIINDDEWAGVMESCASSDLTLDISYQALLMLFGPQLIDALTVANAFTNAVLGYKSDLNIDEARRISGMFPHFQYLIKGFNKIFLTLFFILVALRIFTVAFSAQTSDARKLQVKDAVKKEGVTWASGAMLLFPAGGALSVIQFLFVTGLVFVVMVSKFLATLFFIGNGGLSLLSVVDEEAKPILQAMMSETIAYNMCGYELRDDIIEGVKAARTYTDSELVADPYVNCVTNTASVTPIQINPDNMFNISSGITNSIGNGTTLDVYSVNYHVGINARIQNCASQYAKDYINVASVDGCGSVELTAPPTDEEVKARGYLKLLEDVFFYEGFQKDLEIIAAASYEGICRGKIGYITSSCYRVDITDSRLPIMLDTNRDGSTRLSLIPHGSSVLANQEFARIQQSKYQAIRNYLSEKMGIVAAARLNYDQGNEDVATKLGIEEDIKKIKNQIDKGIWISGVAFINQFGQQLNTALISQTASESYDVKLPLLYQTALYVADTVGVIEIHGKESGWMPSISLFSSLDKCWQDPLFCAKVPLNPFGAMVEDGVKIFERSFAIVAATGIVDFGLTKSGISIHKGVSDTIIIYGYIYLLIGLLFTVLIPLMAMFTLLGRLINWLKDVVIVVFSLTLDVAVSPLLANEEKMVAQPIRNAFKSLYVLSAHLVFIAIGIIVCFLLLSFLMGINVILFGIIFNLFGLNDGSVFDELVYPVIRDIVITGVLFFEVKFAISMINKIPEALAMHYELEYGQDEPVFEQFTNILKTQVMPNLLSIFRR